MGQNTHSRRFKEDDICGVGSALHAERGQRRAIARSADQRRPVRMVKAPDRGRFLPVLARTRSIRRSAGPMVYDCLKLVFVRSWSAIVFSEFGHQPVSFGDAILIGPNVLFSAEPEDYVTLTAIYVDTDFALDQFFWQHSTVLHDRLDAQGFCREGLLRAGTGPAPGQGPGGHGDAVAGRDGRPSVLRAVSRSGSTGCRRSGSR